jgi:hypothetical protein
VIPLVSVSLSAAKSDFVAFLQFRKLPVSLPSHLLRAGSDRARVAGKWLQKGNVCLVFVEIRLLRAVCPRSSPTCAHQAKVASLSSCCPPLLLLLLLPVRRFTVIRRRR